MPEPAFIGSAQVAKRLHRSTRWFRAARRRLEAHGFPPPVAELSRPPLWSAAAVDGWISRQAVGGVGSGGDDLRAQLAERARQIAERRGRRGRPSQ